MRSKSRCLLTGLLPQLDHLAAMQQALAALPGSLQALAQQAAGEAVALQARHGFSLQGLQQLLGVQVGAPPTPPPAPSADGGALTGSLLPSAGPGGGGGWEEQRRYVASVLQRFAAKLEGQAAPGSGRDEEGSAAAAAAGAGVEAQVERLIAAATSPERLARMYEGWMPWV